MTRTGKIARLPRAVREELNRRLDDGEQAAPLLAWLNALPEVRAVLERDFAGKVISPQNLSEWKQGGFQDWLAHQETCAQVRELAGHAAELGAAGGPLAENLATLFAAGCLPVLARWSGKPGELPAEKLRTLGALGRTIHSLRRGEHSAERLKLDQARLGLKESQAAERILALFDRWNREPAELHRRRENAQHQAARLQEIRKLMFGDLDRYDPDDDPAPGSEKVRPKSDPTHQSSQMPPSPIQSK